MCALCLVQECTDFDDFWQEVCQETKKAQHTLRRKGRVGEILERRLSTLPPRRRKYVNERSDEVQLSVRSESPSCTPWSVEGNRLLQDQNYQPLWKIVRDFNRFNVVEIPSIERSFVLRLSLVCGNARDERRDGQVC